MQEAQPRNLFDDYFAPLAPQPVDEESAFRSWYGERAAALGLNPDPDDPQHFYDYRAAYRAGAEPGPDGHWPSEFKRPGHPNQFVDGIDTITGERQPPPWAGAASRDGGLPPDTLGAQFRAGAAEAGGALAFGLPEAALRTLAGGYRPGEDLEMFGPLAATLERGADYLAGQRGEVALGASAMAPPAEGIAENLVRAVPQTAAYIAPFALGPVAGAAAAYGQTYAGALNQATDAGVDPRTAILASAPSAAVQTAVELMAGPEGAILFKSGARGAGQIILEITKKAVGEGAEEVAQSGIDYLARIAEGQFDDVPARQVVDQFLSEAGMQFAVGSLLGAPTSAGVVIGQAANQRREAAAPPPIAEPAQQPPEAAPPPFNPEQAPPQGPVLALTPEERAWVSGETDQAPPPRPAPDIPEVQEPTAEQRAAFDLEVAQEQLRRQGMEVEPREPESAVREEPFVQASQVSPFDEFFAAQAEPQAAQQAEPAPTLVPEPPTAPIAPEPVQAVEQVEEPRAPAVSTEESRPLDVVEEDDVETTEPQPVASAGGEQAPTAPTVHYSATADFPRHATYQPALAWAKTLDYDHDRQTGDISARDAEGRVVVGRDGKPIVANYPTATNDPGKLAAAFVRAVRSDIEASKGQAAPSQPEPAAEDPRAARLAAIGKEVSSAEAKIRELNQLEKAKGYVNGSRAWKRTIRDPRAELRRQLKALKSERFELEHGSEAAAARRAAGQRGEHATVTNRNNREGAELEAAFNEGLEAARSGVTENPYAPASELHAAWNKGQAEHAGETEREPGVDFGEEPEAAEESAERLASDHAERGRRSLWDELADLPPEIKALRRQIAKLTHPDQATDEADRERRTAFMAATNNAADKHDKRQMEEILAAWHRGDPLPPGRTASAPRPAAPPKRPQPRPTPESEPRPEPSVSPEENEARTQAPPSSEPSATGAPKTKKPVRLTMADLTELAERLGSIPKISRTLRRARGLFVPSGRGKIKLAAWIAEDAEEAMRTFRHEIGHWIDYLDASEMTRGNILGRIAVLKHYFLKTIDELPTNRTRALNAEDYKYLRREATKAAGKRPKKGDTAGERAYAERLKRIYTEMRDAEIARRGLVSKTDIMEELVQLSEEMRGPITAEDHEYRMHSTELYADAFSAMLGDPELAERVAPKFSQMVNDYFYRKPEVQAVWNDIMARSPEEAAAHQVGRSRESQREGAELRAKQMSERQKLPALKAAFADLSKKFFEARRVFYKMRNDAVRKKSPDAKKIVHLVNLIEESSLGTAAKGYYTELVTREVWTPLEKLGVKLEDLGAFMLMRRATTEREKLFNPGGVQQREFDQLKKELGAEKVASVEEALDRYWKIRQKEIIGPYLETDQASPELEHKMRTNTRYARITILRAIRDAVRSGIPGVGQIRSQLGTLQQSGNAFLETILQDVQLIDIAHRGKTTNALVDILRETGTLTPAKRGQHGVIREPRDPEKANIKQMVRGKIVAWEVPKELADFYGRAPYEFEAAMKISDKILRAVSLGFVGRNPLFPILGLPKDAWATWANFVQRPPKGKRVISDSPLIAPIKHALWVMKYAAKGVATALNPSLSASELEMMEHRALLRVGSQVWDPEKVTGDDVIAVLQHRFSLGDLAHAKTAHARGKRVLEAVIKALEYVPSVSERGMKIAAWELAKAKMPWLSTEERAALVRSRGSTPVTTRAGTLTPNTNAIAMFSNVAKEGLRASGEAARQDPVLWAMKKAMLAVIPAILTKALQERWLDDLLGDELGEELADWTKKIPSYVKSSRLLFPLGMVSDGLQKMAGDKAVYLKFPLDYEDEALRRITWFALDGARPDHVKQLLTDLIPGMNLNPLLNIAKNLATTATGGNPKDSLGRDIIKSPWRLKQPVLSAARWEPVLKESWNETPLGNLYRFDSDRPEEISTELEDVLHLPGGIGPGLSRLIGVSDYGLAEEQRSKLETGDAQKAAAYHRSDVFMSEILKQDRDANALEWYQLYKETEEQYALDRDEIPYIREKSDFKSRFKELRAKRFGTQAERLAAGLTNEQKARLEEEEETEP